MYRLTVVAGPGRYVGVYNCAGALYAIEERVRFSFVQERLHGFDPKTGLNLRRKQR